MSSVTTTLALFVLIGPAPTADKAKAIDSLPVLASPAPAAEPPRPQQDNKPLDGNKLMNDIREQSRKQSAEHLGPKKDAMQEALQERVKVINQQKPLLVLRGTVMDIGTQSIPGPKTPLDRQGNPRQVGRSAEYLNGRKVYKITLRLAPDTTAIYTLSYGAPPPKVGESVTVTAHWRSLSNTVLFLGEAQIGK